METADRLIQEINAKIDYFRLEYSVTYAEVIGCLEMIKFDILSEATEGGE